MRAASCAGSWLSLQATHAFAPVLGVSIAVEAAVVFVTTCIVFSDTTGVQGTLVVLRRNAFNLKHCCWTSLASSRHRPIQEACMEYRRLKGTVSTLKAPCCSVHRITSRLESSSPSETSRRTRCFNFCSSAYPPPEPDNGSFSWMQARTACRPLSLFDLRLQRPKQHVAKCP